MDGVPLEGAEAESADGCLVGVDKKTPAAMLLAVLEHVRSFTRTLDFYSNPVRVKREMLSSRSE